MSFTVEAPLRVGEIAECLSCLHQCPVLCELVSTLEGALPKTASVSVSLLPEHTIGPFSLPVEVRMPLCRECTARLGSELSRRARRARRACK